MKRTIALLLVCIGMALPYLKSMEVMPTQADWSGWTARDGWVGTTFTANFDSIAEVSLFTGSPGAGQNYNLEVRDAQTSDLIAHQYNKSSAGDHRWLKFDSIVPDGRFARGREYVAKFTRPGDSISWYKSTMSVYRYGHMGGCAGHNVETWDCATNAGLDFQSPGMTIMQRF